MDSEKALRRKMIDFIEWNTDELSEFLTVKTVCEDCPVMAPCCKFIAWAENPANKKPDADSITKLKEHCCYVMYLRILQAEAGKYPRCEV